MNLPRFAVARPHTVVMLFLAIALMGTVSLLYVNVDFLPEIEPPAISVLVPYPGASATDVENDVTKYLEDQLSTVNDLDKLRSLSKDNLSMVTCLFPWGTDLDVASDDVRDKVDLAKPDIHEHAPTAEEPMLFKFSSATAPILVVAVSATTSWKQLYRLVDERIVDPLKRIKGVGAIAVYGGPRRQIRVEFDMYRLAGYGLTAEKVIRTLAAENVDMPAGDVKMGTRQYTIRLSGRFQGPEEVGAVIVGTREGKLVHLRDVAEVRDAFEEPRMYGWSDGRDAVVFIVQKRSGANTVAVCRAVRERLAELGASLPADVHIAIPEDNSEFILNSLRNLAQTLLVAGALVILVTVLFLRRARASLIIILVIPSSLIIAFIFMFLKGYTINVVSLMSISIAIGMVVDNAIVVLENITRHVEGGGERPKEAAVFAASEVGGAIVASTLTTVAVFVPLIYVSGLSGIIFDQLAIIVAITLGASLFTALTLTPMLASKWVRSHAGRTPGRLYRASERAFQGIEGAYTRLLAGSLRHRGKLLAALALVFAATLPLLRFMGSDLFPDVDSGDIRAFVTLDESTRLEETAAVMRRMSAIYAELVPEARTRFAFCGETKKGIGVALGFGEGPNVGQGGVKLVPKGDRRRSAKDIAARLREEVEAIPGIERLQITVSTPVKQVLFGGGKKIEVEIIGHDLEVTDRLAERVRAILASTPGAVDVSVSRKRPRQEVHVTLDREKAASLGVTAAAIGAALRAHYYGFEATKYRDAGDDFDVFVRLEAPDRRTLDAFGQVTIPSRDDEIESVRLADVARIAYAAGPVQIERKNRERIVKVGADVYGRSLGEVKRDVAEKIGGIEPPPGITIGFGGEVEEQRKAFRDLRLLVIVGLALVYMVMVSQFESLKTPLVIAFSIPFAFTGVIWAFYLTGTTLNVMSFMAIVMLVGVVVNNAIVLLDYANILRARGLSLEEAIRRAGRDRLRPVLMTSLTTVFGLLPLAVSRGEGAEMWRPFGITAIGGLSLSTLVTLVLVPIMYTIIEGRGGRRKGA